MESALEMAGSLTKGRRGRVSRQSEQAQRVPSASSLTAALVGGDMEAHCLPPPSMDNRHGSPVSLAGCGLWELSRIRASPCSCLIPWSLPAGSCTVGVAVTGFMSSTRRVH